MVIFITIEINSVLGDDWIGGDLFLPFYFTKTTYKVRGRTMLKIRHRKKEGEKGRGHLKNALYYVSKQALTDWCGSFTNVQVIPHYIPIRIDQCVLPIEAILVPKGKHYGKVGNTRASSFNFFCTRLNFKPTKVNACFFLLLILHFYSYICYILEGLFGNLECNINFVTSVVDAETAQ